MDTEKVYTTSLRLYKNRPVHHQAYRYLKEYNKDIFKTHLCQVGRNGEEGRSFESGSYGLSGFYIAADDNSVYRRSNRSI